MRPGSAPSSVPILARWGAILSLAALVLGGCAGALTTLPREDDAQPFAQLKQAGSQFTRSTDLVETSLPGERQPVRVAVHRVNGPAVSDRVIVLLHGVFSDSEAWRFVTGPLAERANLWLVDLPGCGASDKPRPSRAEEDAYAPTWLARRILAALDHELAGLDPPPRLTVVAHSLSGLVAIHMLADEATQASPARARIDRLVLLSPVDAAIHRPDPFFARLATIEGWEVTLGSLTGYLDSTVTQGTIDSVCDPACALREEAQKRCEILRDPVRRRAMQAMLQKAYPRRGKRTDWDAVEPVVALYGRVRVPCLIVWGERDETLPLSMGYKLAAQIPGAGLLPLPRTMHSPHLEDPARCVEIIGAFSASGLAPEDALILHASAEPAP